MSRIYDRLCTEGDRPIVLGKTESLLYRLEWGIIAWLLACVGFWSWLGWVLWTWTKS